jgi:hypothetical protein
LTAFTRPYIGVGGMRRRMETPEPPTPGTYRVADGARVEFSAAMTTWVPIAHEILPATASRYHSVITYSELSEEVQERSGIRTRMLLANWIGKLLENVAIDVKARAEPPLTSLCVHQDGSIGEGYARAPKSVAGPVGDDIEVAAADHRLLCHRAYAVDLPSDGGVAALTSQVVARRARLTPRVFAQPEACPNCRMTVPATGVCDECGWQRAPAARTLT